MKRVKDYEWGSMGQYMVQVSGIMGLVSISSDAVNSCPVGRLGVKIAGKRKRATAKALLVNMDKVRAYVKSFDGKLGEDELVALRSIYVQHRENVLTVKRHLEAIQAVKDMKAVALVDPVGDDAASDDLLF